MDTLEKEIWKTNYVQPLFDKYQEVPTKLKYMFIEKDYSRMFGSKKQAEDRMRYMYDDTETFIFAFNDSLAGLSKTVKKNVLKKYFEDLALFEWFKYKESGTYFKYFSGRWSQDKEYFTNVVTERENKKEYVKLILG